MKKLIRVVGAIIENDDAEILCALRSPKMSIPNTWEFPGGKIEGKETLKDAAIREIKEELNCTVEFIDRYSGCITTFIRKGIAYIVITFSSFKNIL